MLTVEQALEQLMADVPPLRIIEKPLAEAQGCVLARDITGPMDLPPLP